MAFCKPANWEIGVPGFPTQAPTLTSDFTLNEFTFGPFRRSAFLVPGRARAVSAVPLPVEAEQLLAVFQIDAGDRYPRSLARAAQILQLGSAVREDYSSGLPAAVIAVAAPVVAAAVAFVVAVAAPARRSSGRIIVR